MWVQGHATLLVCSYTHLPTRPRCAILLLFAEFQRFEGWSFSFATRQLLGWVSVWEHPTTLSTGPLHLMAVSTLRWSWLYWWLWCNFNGLQPTSVTWGRLILGAFPQSKEICQAGGIAVLVTQQPTVATAQNGGCSWPLSMAPMCLKLQVRLVNCCHPAREIAAF